MEPEVEEWLESLDAGDFGHVAFYIDLSERLERRHVRISYFVASGRRIVLLTVFHKRRAREKAEVHRAYAAMQRCVAEGHTAED